MKELFNYLVTIIESIVYETGHPKAGQRVFNHVDLWNDQINKERDRQQKRHRWPAVFIELIVNDSIDYSLGVKVYDLSIRFRIANKGLTFVRLDELDLRDTFDLNINGLRGSEIDPVQFSSLQEVETEFDENHDNVNEPYIEYKTFFKYTKSYRRRGLQAGTLGSFASNGIEYVITKIN